MQDFINGKRKKESGFTIIEVVLVLAIAGLIFLIVFLALPQLQRSRRDTQRRGDAGKIISSLEAYASNAGGVYPTSSSTFVADYITGKIVSPDSTAYAISWTTAITSTSATNSVYIANTSTCNGTGVSGGGTARQVAVQIKLEEGIFCQDNQ